MTISIIISNSPRERSTHLKRNLVWLLRYLGLEVKVFCAHSELHAQMPPTLYQEEWHYLIAQGSMEDPSTTNELEKRIDLSFNVPRV